MAVRQSFCIIEMLVEKRLYYVSNVYDVATPLKFLYK